MGALINGSIVSGVLNAGTTIYNNPPTPLFSSLTFYDSNELASPIMNSYGSEEGSATTGLLTDNGVQSVSQIKSNIINAFEIYPGNMVSTDKIKKILSNLGYLEMYWVWSGHTLTTDELDNVGNVKSPTTSSYSASKVFYDATDLKTGFFIGGTNVANLTTLTPGSSGNLTYKVNKAAGVTIASTSSNIKKMYELAGGQ
ncbi:hypothetical protein [Lentilactobacillus kosonis]|uniref:Uncharacterized protein n=1 Tax=Lentilactobacillus kosonis TaxID=2810561 RepID=A0A401FQ10_9LACO|nr:hypothetical protein [Lentilactobacillus kosonis]GAY74301.1 hypothetical protein NBRC111893_2447 [Lentilactobacillus kosonis]